MDWTIRWWVLITPEQLGPRIRQPCASIISLIRAWTFFPSAPVSAKPAVSTTMKRTPFLQHSSIAAGAASAGTITMARSTSPGTSRMLRKALTPWTSGFFAFTG